MDPELFANIIRSYFPQQHASLMNGILFGIPIRGQQLFYEELKTVGLVHIVVLSGMNITLIANLIMNITVRLGKKISLLLTITAIILFILFVGAEPPIVRAGCMSILTLVGVLFGRKTIALYTLFLSGVFIAIFWPEWITGISFQLSFAATFGLIIFGKVKNKDNSNSLLSYVNEELHTSLAAQVFTVPIIFFYFRNISFISPISNILVSWTIGPLMAVGFITAVLGLVHPLLGIIPAYICYAILTYIISVVEILAKIPFAAIDF